MEKELRIGGNVEGELLCPGQGLSPAQTLVHKARNGQEPGWGVPRRASDMNPT